MTDSSADITPDDAVPVAPFSHLEIPVATATERRRLDGMRNDLLRVHRGLLEAERNRYEKQHGRIANNSAFLQLVINDPWFEWLRPMAQMVLLIDERTSDKKQPLGSVEADALFEQSLALLKADDQGDHFQRLFSNPYRARRSWRCWCGSWCSRPRWCTGAGRRRRRTRRSCSR